jgi:FAD/FMN-containing dehydrogenase
MFPFTLSHALTLLTLTAHLTNAAPAATTLEACTEISKALPNKNFLPSTKEYKKENKDYYHAGLAELTPACIAFPSSAQDVRTIINILNVHKDVKFAVKSGGHSPNPGQASIKDGVLIALRNLAGTTLNKETGLAEVKPGGHWWDVMKFLDGTGRMVVGGRLGVVGLGELV